MDYCFYFMCEPKFFKNCNLKRLNAFDEPLDIHPHLKEEFICYLLMPILLLLTNFERIYTEFSEAIPHIQIPIFLSISFQTKAHILCSSLWISGDIIFL